MLVLGVILVRIFPYSVRMWENTDQNNFKYGKILQNEIFSETVDLDLQLSIKWSP